MLDEASVPPGEPDALSLGQTLPETLDRDELLVEVRRLRLRLEALREQRDERIAQIRELEPVLGEAQQALGNALQADTGAESWRGRALDAESTLAALYATRSMRLLRVPRSIYGQLRAAAGRG
jgi:hypothetical protein